MFLFIKIRERKVLGTKSVLLVKNLLPWEKGPVNKTAKGKVIINIITFFFSLQIRFDFEKTNSY